MIFFGYLREYFIRDGTFIKKVNFDPIRIRRAYIAYLRRG